MSIKIISFREWQDKWEDDLLNAYDNFYYPGYPPFNTWAKDQYRMWKEDAEDRNIDG